MSVLSDFDLRKEIARGYLLVDPLADDAIQPASIDVRLGRSFIKFTDSYPENFNREIDPRIPERDTRQYEQDEFVIPAHEMVLGCTTERFRIPESMLAIVHGKSSIGRLGLCVHITAGLLDPGWMGRITLEIYNFRHRPIRLVAGMKIAQVELQYMHSPCEVPYGDPSRRSRYQGDMGAVASKVAENL